MSQTARATHLARAWLAQKTYKSVENRNRQPLPVVVRVAIAEMIQRYGTIDLTKEQATGAVHAWINVLAPKKPITQADTDAAMKRLANR